MESREKSMLIDNTSENSIRSPAPSNGQDNYKKREHAMGGPVNMMVV